MSNKRKIRIKFEDFWPTFDPKDNFFYDFLSRRYDVELVDDPDFLIYSLFGRNFEKYDCVRIFFSGEVFGPNLKECDYAFSCRFPNGNSRLYRLPQYAQYGNPKRLLETPNVEKILREKTRFCNFVYSNPSNKDRVKFFKQLSKYKKVDSGGKFLNNVGGPVPDKFDFINKYKFTIAFENESYPGYTTEKIYEPMRVDSLPIYYGNPFIGRDFNPESFVNVHDFKDFDDAIDFIIELDKNVDKYVEMIKKPFFKKNEVNEFVKEENIAAQFERIFSEKVEPVARKSWYFSKNPLLRTIKKISVPLEYETTKMSRRVKYFSLAKVKMRLKI